MFNWLHLVNRRPCHHARAGVAQSDGAMAAGEQGSACIHAFLQATSAMFSVPQQLLQSMNGMLQDKEEVDGRYSKQKMVLGTHTSEGEQNYLMLAEVQLGTVRQQQRL